MTVYVDNARIPARVYDPETGRWYRGWWSHLTADTQPELHAFAARLGMKRSWFQTCKRPCGKEPCPHWHYDLLDRRRETALRLGAQSMDLRDWAQICRARRDAARQ